MRHKCHFGSTEPFCCSTRDITLVTRGGVSCSGAACTLSVDNPVNMWRRLLY